MVPYQLLDPENYPCLVFDSADYRYFVPDIDEVRWDPTTRLVRFGKHCRRRKVRRFGQKVYYAEYFCPALYVLGSESLPYLEEMEVPEWVNRTKEEAEALLEELCAADVPEDPEDPSVSKDLDDPTLPTWVPALIATLCLGVGLLVGLGYLTLAIHPK